MYNNNKTWKVAQSFAIACLILATACDKTGIEPVKIIEPKRTIHTEAMQSYKSNLNSRPVSIGYLYNWGKSDASILMHTPDSLDIIVVTNGYDNLNAAQAEDLNSVKATKATKVLVGIDFNANIISPSDLTDTISTRQKRTLEALTLAGATSGDITAAMAKVETDAVNWAKAIAIYEYNQLLLKATERMQQNQFDGLSILLPTTIGYLQEPIAIFFKNLGDDFGIGKSHILIIENPYSSLSNSIARANWLVYKKQTPDFYLKYFSDDAALFSNSKFVPSADYTHETDADGFLDSETFSASGILPRTIDITHWNAPNKGGAAFYHIEKNYTDISGSETYSSLRKAIKQLQFSEK